jgi:hypothetical protein
VWDVPDALGDDRLPDLDPDAGLPRLLRTVSAGRTIHDTEVTA